LTHSVCPYCAVGCGLLVFTKGARPIAIEGNPDSRRDGAGPVGLDYPRESAYRCDRLDLCALGGTNARAWPRVDSMAWRAMEQDDLSEVAATASAVRCTVVHVREYGIADTDDHVAVEEPLEIRLGGMSLAVTMRTPGDDEELVAGFLHYIYTGATRIAHRVEALV
jgi:hypothetical protein